MADEHTATPGSPAAAPTDQDVEFCARVAYAAWHECFNASGNEHDKPKWNQLLPGRKAETIRIARDVLAGAPPRVETLFGRLFQTVVRVTYQEVFVRGPVPPFRG